MKKTGAASVAALFIFMLFSAGAGCAAKPRAVRTAAVPDAVIAGAEASEPQTRRVAYVTIDDGPSREVTPELLGVLEKHGVKAVFFVLPHPELDGLYRDILAAGHVIGSHSYSHDYMTLYGGAAADFERDTVKMRDWLSSRYNVAPSLYRFPGGIRSRPEETVAERTEILARLGYRYFEWDVSLGDAADTTRDPETLAQNALGAVGERDSVIILLHDSSGMTATPDALDLLITALKTQGFVFDTLDNFGA
ncbi:MAG: polysaccharide deacetylase family protein [Oscillospiraceae bacterium]|nr:polysaccharide deacetylase family protein [Oscillospiraceae bacterium]